MKKLTIILLSSLFVSVSIAQDKLNVQGDGVITGRLNLGTGNNLIIGNGGTNITTSCCNTVIGRDAGLAINNFNSHTLIGVNAGRNSFGGENTFIGTSAGVNVGDGFGNVIVGNDSGTGKDIGANCVFIGRTTGNTDTTGNHITLVGASADVSGAALGNAMALGASAVVNASNKVRIGNSSVSVIEGQVAYSFPSDGRFKTNVRAEVPGLDFILKLRPVTYNFDLATYNKHVKSDERSSLLSQKELNDEYEAIERSKSVRQTGFIAQEVETAAQSIGYDFDGVVLPQNVKDNYSLRYSTFVVPLVQAVQDQQDHISDLQNTTAEQEERIADLEQKNADLFSELIQLKAMVNHLLKPKGLNTGEILTGVEKVL